MSEYMGQMDAALNTLYDTSYEAGYKAGREAGMREAAAIAQQGQWEHCDCGCPSQQKPKSAQAVGAIRAAAAILSAIGGDK